jgi:hypothetical protein
LYATCSHTSYCREETINKKKRKILEEPHAFMLSFLFVPSLPPPVILHKRLYAPQREEGERVKEYTAISGRGVGLE